MAVELLIEPFIPPGEVPVAPAEACVVQGVDNTFIRDTGTDCVMYYAFNTTDEANAAMEAFLKDYTGNVEPRFDYESKATYAAEFESIRGMFLLLGGTLSFIVGLVGILNFANAILTGITARRRELAVLQAIGMTTRQLRWMLALEGLLYTLGAALLALALVCASAPFTGPDTNRSAPQALPAARSCFVSFSAKTTPGCAGECKEII